MREIELPKDCKKFEMIAAVSGLITKGYQVNYKYHSDINSNHYIPIKKIEKNYVSPFEFDVFQTSGEHIRVSLNNHAYFINMRISYNSIMYNIESSIRSFVANNTESLDTLKKNNFKPILEPILKYKFVEENFKKIIDFGDWFKDYANQKLKTDYSISALSEFSKIINLIDNKDLLYQYVETNKINEFIDFLERFRREKDESIKSIDFRKIKIFREKQIIKIYFSTLCIFNEINLEKFKYIPHPGLYLALHVLESETSIKNKFLKEKLKKI